MDIYDPNKHLNTVLEVDSKHLWARTILFVLAFVIAIVAFTRGILSLGAQKPGYYELTAAPCEDAPYYASEFRYTAWFDGSSNEIKQNLKQAEADYSRALEFAYKLLDPENEYRGYVNIASINSAIKRGENAELTLPEELYAVLKDAVSKTDFFYSPSAESYLLIKDRSYNVFAGPIYYEWKQILIADDGPDFDPDIDYSEGPRMALIASLSDDRRNFDILFVDDKKCVIKAAAAPEAISALEQLELYDAPVIDLNLLRDAYLMQIASDMMEARGWNKGVFQNYTGLTVQQKGVLEMNGEHKGSERFFVSDTISHKALNDKDYYHYELKVGNRMRYRSIYFRVWDGTPVDDEYGADLKELYSDSIADAVYEHLTEYFKKQK
ncbi:MAG: hypothetical protein IJM08_00155 [Firmicutes bacterium]|nr:hypothetical protein [Bacillota bacterium]